MLVIFVGGSFVVVVKYFIIIYFGFIVGFLVGNVLVGAVGAVVDCAIDSVLSLCFSFIILIPYQTSHFHYSQFTSFHL